jgi:DNA mismatch repair protein MutS
MPSKKKPDALKQYLNETKNKNKEFSCGGNNDGSVLENYLRLLKSYQQEFKCQKLTIFMQVGSFFEVYGIKFIDDNTTEGNVWEVASILNIKVANKLDTTVNGREVKQFMAGCKEEYVDDYIHQLSDEGWTIPIFIQEKENGRVKGRKLETIISPGTNVETNDISNYFMYVYMKGSPSIRQKRTNSLIISIFFVDCISGDNSVMELTTQDINNYSVVFSEVIKLFSIYNPKELIIHLDIVNINNFPQFQQQELYNTLQLHNRNVSIIREVIDKKYHQVEIQKKVLERCYSSYQGRNTIFQQLGLNNDMRYYIIGMCLGLDAINKINPNIITLLNKPEIIQESSHYLMLANNCLQQLDIVNDERVRRNEVEMDYDYENLLSGVSTKKITLLKLLDKTKTTMGRRMFKKKLTLPITNVEKLEMSYQQIEELRVIQMKHLIKKNGDFFSSPLNDMRGQLQVIRDISKNMRQIATQTLLPNHLDMFLASVKGALDLNYSMNVICQCNNIKKDNKINTLIPRMDNEEREKVEEMLDYIKSQLILEKCDNHWNNIEGSIFQKGVYSDFDKLEERIRVNQSFTKLLRSEMTKLMKPDLKYKNVRDFVKEDFLIGIDNNAKLGKYLYCNARGKKMWELAVSNNNNNNNNNNNDSNNKNNNNKNKNSKITIGEYNIPYQSITLKPISAGKFQVVCNEILESCGTLIKSIEDMRKMCREKFKEWQLELFKKYKGCLENVIQFVGETDVLQSMVTVSMKLGLTRPEIKINGVVNGAINKDSEKIPHKSYIDIKDIKHPIISAIHTDVPYITNNALFGKDGCNGVLLFGVNASGKSSYAKSIGIAIIMAQAGMYVPAREMVYYPYNYLFTRIRNNDDIYAGLSSFEVEMQEFKVILQHGNENSMILGDELCSGTETLDATAIMASGLKKLHDRGCSFIFATHLHFLAELEYVSSLENLKFKHLTVELDPENNNRVIYRRKIKNGNGPQSYGILVCQSMKLEKSFIDDAVMIRRQIENGELIKFNGRLTNSGELVDYHTSAYNKEKHITRCEVCQEVGTDIHHIHQQADADNCGVIEGDAGMGVFHKNEKWNLVCLCKECHQSVHSSPSRLEIKGYYSSSDGIILEYEWINRVIDNVVRNISAIDSREDVNDVGRRLDGKKELEFKTLDDNLRQEIVDDILRLSNDGKTYKSIQYKIKKDKSCKISLKDIRQIVG